MKRPILLSLAFLAITGFVLTSYLNDTDWPEYNGTAKGAIILR